MSGRGLVLSPAGNLLGSPAGLWSGTQVTGQPLCRLWWAGPWGSPSQTWRGAHRGRGQTGPRGGSTDTGRGGPRGRRTEEEPARQRGWGTGGTQGSASALDGVTHGCWRLSLPLSRGPGWADWSQAPSHCPIVRRSSEQKGLAGGQAGENGAQPPASPPPPGAVCAQRSQGAGSTGQGAGEGLWPSCRPTCCPLSKANAPVASPTPCSEPLSQPQQKGDSQRKLCSVSSSRSSPGWWSAMLDTSMPFPDLLILSPLTNFSLVIGPSSGHPRYSLMLRSEAGSWCRPGSPAGCEGAVTEPSAAWRKGPLVHAQPHWSRALHARPFLDGRLQAGPLAPTASGSPVCPAAPPPPQAPGPSVIGSPKQSALLALPPWASCPDGRSQRQGGFGGHGAQNQAQGSSPTASSPLGTRHGLGQPALGGGGGTAQWALR